MTKKHKIHLVEDDPAIASNLIAQLTSEEFEVLHSNNIAHFKKQTHNFVQAFVLDVGLPDGTGFDLVPLIREKSSAPILFMTALNTAENRLKGFELGAHEFIPKPFLFKELLLRLRHVLEETPQRLTNLRLKTGTLDLDKMCFESNSGSSSFIPARDFRVLQLLIQEAPKPVSRDHILDTVWGEDKFPTHRTIDNVIVRLRQTIGDEEGLVIRSIRGIGYQWTPESETESVSADPRRSDS